MSTDTGQVLTTPQVARLLGIDAAEVYRLIFSGALDGGPGEDGRVYVSADALARYLRACRDPTERG